MARTHRDLIDRPPPLPKAVLDKLLAVESEPPNECPYSWVFGGDGVMRRAQCVAATDEHPPSHHELPDDEAVRVLLDARAAGTASGMLERLRKAGVVLARRRA